ncbi:hypothetical protein [Acetobacter okinawensis]|uniref:hypothetical protein n=1 Tax=Acetobacter okinawensis TaxID=1076594 RepID=UPI00209FD80D|nr:hypothetical protein [Acetobacter okinawensis]MCP1213992.1 hypothetical protein [Acetobacter okinawensis]
MIEKNIPAVAILHTVAKTQHMTLRIGCCYINTGSNNRAEGYVGGDKVLSDGLPQKTWRTLVTKTLNNVSSLGLILFFARLLNKIHVID